MYDQEGESLQMFHVLVRTCTAPRDPWVPPVRWAGQSCPGVHVGVKPWEEWDLSFLALPKRAFVVSCSAHRRPVTLKVNLCF